MKAPILAALIITVAAACKPHDPTPPAAPEPPSGGSPAYSEAATSEAAENSAGETVALKGMFRYLADAPSFRDCASGKTFPVAMAGPYAELEHTYINSGINNGKALFVELIGRLLEQQDTELKGNQIIMVIDSFKVISESVECAPGDSAALLDTRWKLIEIDGEAVTPPEGGREADLVLESTDFRVRGFSGCNGFFGQYELDGQELTFSALGSTMMACPEGMDHEQAFLAALGQTDRAEIDGHVLNLYADDQRVARLQAVEAP